MSVGWFATRELPDGVFLIAEPAHVNSFLVVGEERAALIDSGLGIDRIRPVAEAMTDRPIEVVNTHYHWDHVGGNAEFTDTAIHELGAEALVGGASAEELRPYLAVIEEVVAGTPPFRALDERLFSFLSEETRVLLRVRCPMGSTPTPGRCALALPRGCSERTT